jgi:hypothetical protein
VSKVNQLTLRGRLAVNRNWALTYHLRYSFEGSDFLSNRGGVEYISKCRCWAIRLELGSDRSGGARFDVQYVLIGLGDDAVRPFSGDRGRGTRDPYSGARNRGTPRPPSSVRLRLTARAARSSAALA